MNKNKLLPLTILVAIQQQNLMTAFLNDLPENNKGLSRREIEQHIQQERSDWNE